MIEMTRDGAVVRQDPITQEQRDALWLQVFSAFLRLHPEELMGGQEAAEPCTSSA